MASRCLSYPEKLLDCEDRISNLPESVLSRILSCLPTEDAVRSSVLSRKWQYKWTSIYNLVIDDSKRCNYSGRLHKRKGTKKADFINFVDRVLFLCKNSTVEKFHLSCLDKYDPSRVKTWITAALSRNVQKLRLLYRGDLFFPRWFLNCDSLTKLELILCTLKLSDNMCYSNLRTLNLDRVEFRNDKSSSPGNLLFTFPVLKVFLSSGSKWWNVKVLRIEAPRLTRFEMTGCVFKSASEGSNVSEIKICGNKVAKFKCTIDMFSKFEFSSASKMLDASLKYTAADDDLILNPRGEIGFRSNLLLRKFSSRIKILELSTDLVQELADAEPPSHLPIFCKLTRLKVYSGQMDIECNLALIDFLKNAPALQSLTFVGKYSSRVADSYDTSELMPGNFLSCLEVAKLEYHYCKPALANNPLVKFLLQHAMVLKELLICSEYERQESEKVKSQLLRFPRLSSHLTILSF